MLRRSVAALAAAVGCALAVTPFATGRAEALPASSTTKPAAGTLDTVSSGGPETALPSGTGCTTRTLYTPFSQWGDDNSYFLVSGGDFEDSSLTSNWRGLGTYQVYVNEPWQVGGWSDSRSAKLGDAGSWLASPTLCVRDSEPTLRFFYRSPGIAGSSLKVTMKTASYYGSTTRTITIDGSQYGWRMTPPLTIDNTTDYTGTQSLNLTFTSQGGAWLIDDVYVDPFKFNIK